MLQNNLWFDLKKLTKWKDQILKGTQVLDGITPKTMGVKMHGCQKTKLFSRFTIVHG